jgi:hypothetical protein
MNKARVPADRPTSPLMGDTAGQRLGEGVVLDLEGHEVPLRAIYQQGPVVLVWLRHYG